MALNKLIAAKICNSRETKFDSLIIKIYEDINKQKEIAINARIEAEIALEREKTAKKLEAVTRNEAVKQKENVQKQLVRTYWNTSQAAIAEDNFLDALHFTSEALVLSKDKQLIKNLLIDIETYLPVTHLKNIFVHRDTVTSALFSPDGKQILTAGKDGTARLWDAKTGKPIGSVMEHKRNRYNYNNVYSAVFSPDGQQVLLASSDSTASLWDTKTGRPIGPAMKHEYNAYNESGNVYNIIFSPDGKQILTASGDGAARLWNLRTGKLIGPPMTHIYGVNSAAFSPDGKYILTASPDETARLWEAGTGKPIGPAMKLERNVYSAVFSPDGKQILTASVSAMVRLWYMEADLDFPPNLFKLQALVTTGCELNIETGEIQLIASERWHKLKQDYFNKAREHYKVCKYPQYNLWRRFNQEDAKKIRLM